MMDMPKKIRYKDGGWMIIITNNSKLAQSYGAYDISTIFDM
ncbi:MAG: hypothetical protein QXT63_00570 [Thermoplasmata archaeon]